VPPWRHARHRRLLLQAAFALLLAGGAWWLADNVADNIASRGLRTGFGFLDQRAGFKITPTLIAFDESRTFARAFLAGLLNTLLVAGLAIPAATAIGLVVGVARMSPSLLGRAAGIYVEIFRNVPPLLVLFFIYGLVLRALPPPRQSWSLFDAIFLNNRGLVLPFPDVPVLQGFNFTGGTTLVPEFVALVLTLTVYQAAYVAETLRGGIQAIAAGQGEAALALGMTRGQALRHVILPQALRVMLPPLVTIYVFIVKGSSLAAAIAYPDLISVFAGTALNIVGHAIEIMLLTGAVYLSVSFGIAALLGLTEARLSARLR
jgi:general L-amino acid transport system permease protein